jgi:hypothetical protein
MIEDSTEEFYTASRREGSFSLPVSQRHGMWALPNPIATTPWLEDAPSTEAMTMVPPRTFAPRPDTDLPFER